MIHEKKMNLPESQNASRKLSDLLDGLGYDTTRVAKRVQAWKKMSDAKTMAAQAILKHYKIERLHVGSNGEGIALAYESDSDILQVNHSVLCVDNLEHVKYDDKIVFHLDRETAPAGYAHLRLLDSGNNYADYMNELEHALVGEERLLSSEKYLCKNEDIFSRGTGYISRNTFYYSVTGPAVPKIIRDGNLYRHYLFGQNLNEDIDFVQSFPCLCPDILTSWSMRLRPQDWPSKEMIEQVNSLPCYVVPVGKKGSYQQDLQWRISFTPAEMYLVHSLNDTQRKVLIILRYIAKHRLKHICPDITSYIVKNVMFWVSEEIPLDQFQSHLLLERLADALKFLRTCVSGRSLQNYMIPERDLFQDKLTLSEQSRLKKELSNIITDILYSRIKKMSSKLSARLAFCTYIDAISAEVADLFTTERLAEFIIRSDECSNHLNYTICYHWYITLPYIRKHLCRIPRGRIRAAWEALYVANLPIIRLEAGTVENIALPSVLEQVETVNDTAVRSPGAAELRSYVYIGLSLVAVCCIGFLFDGESTRQVLIPIICAIIHIFLLVYIGTLDTLIMEIFELCLHRELWADIFECCLPDTVQLSTKRAKITKHRNRRTSAFILRDR